MNIDIELVIGLITIVCAFASAVWQVAQAKSEIYNYIKTKTDSIEKKEDLSRYEDELKLEKYQNLIDKEILIINGKVDNCTHKTKRLNESITDINKYLQQVSIFMAKHIEKNNND